MGDEPEESAEAVAEPDVAAEPEATEAAVEEIPEPLPEPVPDSWMAAPDNGEPKADVDPEAVEAAAARYLATRDPRAAAMAHQRGQRRFGVRPASPADRGRYRQS